MDRAIRFLALLFIPLCVFACHRGGTGDIYTAGDIYLPGPVVNSPHKVRVAAVSNDTREVYDVDVIGLLWNGIEDSLKKRGMLWTSKADDNPYIMEGHILYFKEGGMAERFLPYLGDTVLAVRVELSRDGKHVATIESRRKIGFGKGTITRRAWKKIFAEVSQDVVNQAVKKF
jgi:hypothetical protein